VVQAVRARSRRHDDQKNHTCSIWKRTHFLQQSFRYGRSGNQHQFYEKTAQLGYLVFVSAPKTILVISGWIWIRFSQMTLLSICQDAANDLALSAPTAIVGNSDETAVRLLAAAQFAGEALARKPQGGWVAMIREYDFVTAAIASQTGTIANSGAGGVAVISGLTGISSVVANTWWAFGTGVPLDSTVTAVTSTTVTLNQAATTTGTGTFIFGQSDYTLPSDFQRPVDATFWDRSRYWQMRGPLSPQQWQVYKSSVIGQATVQRRFRFRSIGGNTVLSIDPVPTDNNSALVFEYVSNAWCESATGTAQARWAADTDVGVLDEYLITLGVRWRMLRRLGLAYSEELDEYEREVSKAMSSDGGAAILSLVPGVGTYLLGVQNVPESGFGNAV
jgi:hypothetical protein